MSKKKQPKQLTLKQAAKRYNQASQLFMLALYRRAMTTLAIEDRHEEGTKQDEATGETQ